MTKVTLEQADQLREMQKSLAREYTRLYTEIKILEEKRLKVRRDLMDLVDQERQILLKLLEEQKQGDIK